METKYGELNEYYSLKDIANDLGNSINSADDSVRSRVTSGWIKIWANFKGLKLDKRMSAGITKISLTKK